MVNECKIVSKQDLTPGICQNVKTNDIYILVDIDTSKELETFDIHSSQKKYTNKTRYDAQYINLMDLYKN